MNKGKVIRRRLRRVWLVAGASAFVASLAGVQADGVADSVVPSDERVVVRAEGDGVRFQPVRPSGGAGLIFVAGAMVEPRVYAPLPRAVAEAGYRVELIELPYRCAFTAGRIRAVFDSIERRIGALAQRVQGLVLIGRTHPRDFDLSRVGIPLTRIYGTLDGVASPGAMMRNAHLLPGTTRWVAIEGGNHA